VLVEYYKTVDIKKKNRLLKSIIEKATFRRELSWKKIDQFEIQPIP
jgi:hypothetical protein